MRTEHWRPLIACVVVTLASLGVMVHAIRTDALGGLVPSVPAQVLSAPMLIRETPARVAAPEARSNPEAGTPDRVTERVRETADTPSRSHERQTRGERADQGRAVAVRVPQAPTAKAAPGDRSSTPGRARGLPRSDRGSDHGGTHQASRHSARGHGHGHDHGRGRGAEGHGGRGHGAGHHGVSRR